jgi:hypothetical protein
VRGWEGEKGCPVGAGPGALGLARASDAERADRAGGAGVRAGARREGPRQASACMCCGAGGAVKELHTSLVPANDIGVLPSHGRSACGTRTCADQDMKRMKSNKNIRAGECISRSKRSSGSKLSPEWNASAQNLIFSENMMEVTRLESFLNEKKSQYHWLNMNRTNVCSKINTYRRKLNIEIGQAPNNLKICSPSPNMRQPCMQLALKHQLKHTRIVTR